MATSSSSERLRHPYVPGEFETRPQLLDAALQTIQRWTVATYRCFDSRIIDGPTEYYLYLVEHGIEGWANSSWLSTDAKRVCAATMGRKRKSLIDQRQRDAEKQATAAAQAQQPPTTPQRQLLGMSPFAEPTDTLPYSLRPSNKNESGPSHPSTPTPVSRRSARPRPVAHRAASHNRASPAPDDNSKCNEALFDGHHHGGRTTRCANSGAHTTAPHFHPRVSGSGVESVVCDDVDCASYDDFRTCERCWCVVWDGLYSDSMRDEVERALLRKMPVGALALCDDCAPDRFARQGFALPSGEGFTSCRCAHFNVDVSYCGGCRRQELVDAVAGRRAEEDHRQAQHGPPAGNMSCVCGAALVWSATFWECFGCGGMLARALQWWVDQQLQAGEEMEVEVEKDMEVGRSEEMDLEEVERIVAQGAHEAMREEQEREEAEEAVEWGWDGW